MFTKTGQSKMEGAMSANFWEAMILLGNKSLMNQKEIKEE